MMKLTKKQKKHLEVLAGKAYEIDLGRCIDRLFEKYKKWKAGQMTVIDFNQEIHTYHNQIARDLYKTYNMDDPLMAVVFGIKTGAIEIGEVNQDCLPEVERVLKVLNEETIH